MRMRSYDAQTEKEMSIYYSKRFARDFKEAYNKNKNFPDAVDDLIEALKHGRAGRYVEFNMPKSCTGFKIIEDKSLNIKGSRNVGGSFRVLHTCHKNSIIFVRGYAKNKQEGLDTQEQKDVCRSLQTIKNGDCEEQFTKLEKPLSRYILKNKNW